MVGETGASSPLAVTEGCQDVGGHIKNMILVFLEAQVQLKLLCSFRFICAWVLVLPNLLGVELQCPPGCLLHREGVVVWCHQSSHVWSFCGPPASQKENVPEGLVLCEV